MKSHLNRLSQLHPGEVILLLLAHAKLLVLARRCGRPQGAVRKAGDLSAVVRLRSSSHSWSGGRRTRNGSVRLTGTEECWAMNGACPKLETSQCWAPWHLVCVHEAHCMAGQSYGVLLWMNTNSGVSVVHLAVCANLL